MLESAGDRSRNYDLALVIGKRRVHVPADPDSPNLLAESFSQHRHHVKIECLSQQVRTAGDTNIRQVEQCLQIVGLRYSVSHYHIPRHFKDVGEALVFLQ